MKTSKYAPKTPSETLAQSKSERLKQDKNRITRLLGRLRWKAEMLMVSYTRTVEIMQQTHTSSPHVMHSGANSVWYHRHDDTCHQHAINQLHVQTQASSMFKIDFFEFYTLLERYMTACLSVFGISVSGSLSASRPLRQNFNALRYETNPELQRTRPMAEHAFHANLLEALDDEQGPLAGSLGKWEVRSQLGIAKEYRNAWKDADEGKGSGEHERRARLEELRLEDMLRAIVAGCEMAHETVMGYDGDGNGVVASREFESGTYGYGGMEVDVEDRPFEYMEDAMDLD